MEAAGRLTGDAKLEAEGKESKGKALAARLLFLTDLVVADLNATMKAEILAATADGVVTPEEGAKLKAEAMSRVKALLAKNGVKELEAALGILAPSLESLLSGLVESAVARSKVAASPK